MDKRLMLPALAVTLWAQPPSVPDVVPKTDAERALLARAQKFYQLAVDKKYRQAMAMVAEDSQDFFFGAAPDILGFHIDGLEILDENHAKVRFMSKVMMSAPGLINRPFEAKGTSTWKLENGEWSWYADQTGIDTPFGRMKSATGSNGNENKAMRMLAPGTKPTPESLTEQIQIDRTSVTLTGSETQTVRISNALSGPITVEVEAGNIEGLTVHSDLKDVEAHQAATISFQAMPGKKPEGKVGIDVQPFGKHFEVTVSSK